MHLPIELDAARWLVERVVGVAMEHDPSFRDAYVYLTTDQRFVDAGRTHRLGGFHVDGLCGLRHSTRFPVCYAAIVADRAPTVFAVQPFTVSHLDVGRDNIFQVMDAQVDEAQCHTAEEHVAVLMNAHCVHASPVIQESGLRTFIRVEVSHKRFDRIGNTPHPLLSADWQWVPRPFPSGLR